MLRASISRFMSLFFVLTLATAGLTHAQTYQQSVVALLDDAENFSVTTRAIEAAGLTDELRAMDGYTFFAPTDAAWAQLPDDYRAQLFNDRDELADVLRFHLVPVTLTEDDLLARGEPSQVDPRVETLLGDNFTVDAAETGVYIKDAVVIEPNIRATDGIVHAIDKVILPPGMDGAVNR